MKKTTPKLILSPMAGITDLSFRLICKEHGADILYSEMVSAAGLVHSKAKTLPFVNSCQQDSPLIIQLFGNNPKDFAQAIKIINNLPSAKATISSPLEKGGHPAVRDEGILCPLLPEKRCSREAGTGWWEKNNQKTSQPAPRRPEGIDINFGCPVKKVMKQNAGVALMKDPKLSGEIIKSVAGNTSLPISIKIRAGIGNIDAEKFLEKIADFGWEAAIVHGRTFNQGFSGPIDTEQIKRIKGKFPSKKIYANGGVLTPENAIDVLNETRADGVAIARGCLGNPWIYQNIKAFLETGIYSPPNLSEIKKIALHHAQLVKKYKGEKGLIEFRKHLGWYFKGLPGAKNLRKKLFEIKSLKDAEKTIEKV